MSANAAISRLSAGLKGYLSFYFKEKQVKKLDANKKKIFGRFNEVAEGDVVFDEGTGPCSGGARYGNGSIVTKITNKSIVTEDGSFSRKTGNANKPPTAYYIEFWQHGR